MVSAAEPSMSHIFRAENVTVDFGDGNKLRNGVINLFTSKLQIASEGNIIRDILLTQMASIDIHQPIFGANYIIAEHVTAGNQRSTFTMTFNSGGATEFARSFFRVAEGQMVSTENLPQDPPAYSPTAAESKKDV